MIISGKLLMKITMNIVKVDKNHLEVFSHL